MTYHLGQQSTTIFGYGAEMEYGNSSTKSCGKKYAHARGREPTPSAAIVDSQSVKTTSVAYEVGYDGGKLVKGHKRHVLVDTMGLLLQVVVSAANVSEKAGTQLLLEKIEGQFPRLRKIFADGDYEGCIFHRYSQRRLSIRLGSSPPPAGEAVQSPALAVDSGKDARER